MTAAGPVLWGLGYTGVQVCQNFSSLPLNVITPSTHIHQKEMLATLQRGVVGIQPAILQDRAIPHASAGNGGSQT